MNEDVINVSIGMVVAEEGNKVLDSGPMGSCVSVIIYDIVKRFGGMAHVMLPGKPLLGNDVSCCDFRYAENAIPQLISLLKSKGSSIGDLEACIAGGANVLKAKDDVICQENINSVRDILIRSKLSIRCSDVGGEMRKMLSINIATGQVSISCGDDSMANMYLF